MLFHYPSVKAYGFASTPLDKGAKGHSHFPSGINIHKTQGENAPASVHSLHFYPYDHPPAPNGVHLLFEIVGQRLHRQIIVQ